LLQFIFYFNRFDGIVEKIFLEPKLRDYIKLKLSSQNSDWFKALVVPAIGNDLNAVKKQLPKGNRKGSSGFIQ